MRQILALARAEVLHVIRDKATLAQVILMPVVQLIVLANAATFTIRDTAAFVVDLDHSPTSRGLVNRITSSGHFVLTGVSASPEAANEAMLAGDATILLTIPADFEASLMKTGQGSVQLAVNGEKGSTAGIVQSYASSIIAGYARELETEIRPSIRSARPPGQRGPAEITGPIETSSRSWYNPGLNYTHYMVPGILVSLVTIISTLLTAQNIAREKELGTLEQLNVTPITRAQFITAKLLPFWALAMIDLTLGLIIGKLVFGIPLRGSLLLLFGAAAVYLVGTLGIGLYISTLVDTQQQAMFVSFFIMMVYLLMSGLFTPVDSMPHWVQVAAELNPVRHFVTIARAILMKGAGLTEILRPLVILVVFATAIVTLAVRQYRKTTV